MHTIFNIVTTLLLIPFGTYLANFAEKVLPERYPYAVPAHDASYGNRLFDAGKTFLQSWGKTIYYGNRSKQKQQLKRQLME